MQRCLWMCGAPDLHPDPSGLLTSDPGSPGASRRLFRSLALITTLGLLVLGVGPPGVGGQVMQCTGTDGCRCTMDDGSVIDVSSLGNQDGTPKFDKVSGNDNNYYSYNPCYPFSQSSCVDAAVCQTTGDQSSFQAGDASSASWSYDGFNPVAYYESNTDVFRQSYVTFVCDQAASEPEMTAIGEMGIGTYYLTVRSKCACPNGCQAASGGGGGGGLSPGSILLIVFFGLLVVYVVGGIVFNRTQRQATGVEMVPNASFWTSLPGLVKDGFFFLVGKIRGGKAGYSEV